MYVIKASGEMERFRPEKLVRSLVKAGASKGLATQIANEVKLEIWNGITTYEILGLALEKLKARKESVLMLKYDLKRALLSLGPSGYIFEKFISNLLKKYGYETETNVTLDGRCVSQEVDVVARKNGKSFMIECKYHNKRGIKTDLKVAMYTYARFLDLKEYFDGAWLICNTKCTSEAIKYCRCVGVRNTSWAYPPDNWSLESMIERKALYPITILQTLDREERNLALQSDIITVEDALTGGPEALISAGINKKKAFSAMKEIKALIESYNSNKYVEER
ncbi:MAG: ATPase [Thermoproteota archaeon]|nr:MAG: ATPase [Candidatus Korarchaeota archaeon]